MGPARLALDCSAALLRAAGGLSVLIPILAWSAYAFVRLVDELTAAPALASLGGALGIAACRMLCPP